MLNVSDEKFVFGVAEANLVNIIEMMFCNYFETSSKVTTTIQDKPGSRSHSIRIMSYFK